MSIEFIYIMPLVVNDRLETTYIKRNSWPLSEAYVCLYNPSRTGIRMPVRLKEIYVQGGGSWVRLYTTIHTCRVYGSVFIYCNLTTEIDCIWV